MSITMAPALIPSIGWPEGLLILGVVLLIFGPQKLPEVAEAMGKSIRRFRTATKELKDEVISENHIDPPDSKS